MRDREDSAFSSAPFCDDADEDDVATDSAPSAVYKDAALAGSAAGTTTNDDVEGRGVLMVVVGASTAMKSGCGTTAPPSFRRLWVEVVPMAGMDDDQRTDGGQGQGASKRTERGLAQQPRAPVVGHLLAQLGTEDWLVGPCGLRCRLRGQDQSGHEGKKEATIAARSDTHRDDDRLSGLCFSDERLNHNVDLPRSRPPRRFSPLLAFPTPIHSRCTCIM